MENRKQKLALSFGKDSTTIALNSKKMGLIFDEYIFADTLYEFPELYDYIKVIENELNIKVKILKPKKTIEEWMKHKITRGNNKGKYRGFPLKYFPCSYMRDTKVIPINKEKKNSILSIGYAYDELNRVQKDKTLRYPLIEWKLTEKDCVDFLNKKSKLNPLYTNFNRLGCYFCPKQNDMALYVIWKQYPKLWDHMKKLNKLNIKLVSNIIPYGSEPKYTKDKGIEFLENEFKKGYIPKKKPKYECFECKGVSKAFKKELNLNDFCQL